MLVVRLDLSQLAVVHLIHVLQEPHFVGLLVFPELSAEPQAMEHLVDGDGLHLALVELGQGRVEVQADDGGALVRAEVEGARPGLSHGAAHVGDSVCLLGRGSHHDQGIEAVNGEVAQPRGDGLLQALLGAVGRRDGPHPASDLERLGQRLEHGGHQAGLEDRLERVRGEDPLAFAPGAVG